MKKNYAVSVKSKLNTYIETKNYKPGIIKKKLSQSAKWIFHFVCLKFRKKIIYFKSWVSVCNNFEEVGG